MLYHHKNLDSCSSKQPGVLRSFMSINYVKQSRSHNYIVCGSSKLLPSVSLSKEVKGCLLPCFQSGGGCSCCEGEHSDSPEKLLVPPAVTTNNFLDVLDMSSSAPERPLLLNNNKEPHCWSSLDAICATSSFGKPGSTCGSKLGEVRWGKNGTDGNRCAGKEGLGLLIKRKRG